MSKLTPPSPKNLTKRLKFFEEHPEIPNCAQKVYDIKYRMICRDFEQKKIDYAEGMRRLQKLNYEAFQNLNADKKSELEIIKK